MKNIDSLLADFFSPATRRKIYSISALLSLALTAFAGNEAISGAFEGLNPIFVGIFAGIAGIVSLLARANVNEEDNSEEDLSTDVDEEEWDGTLDEDEGDEDYTPSRLRLE